ncbi:MAG: HD domain-containing protein [Actinomycetota bacterium]
MNPINERDIGALADAVRRRRQAFSSTTQIAESLEQHAYRVAALVDDLAEGESLNALDYMVLRVAAVLHDAARPKSATPEASALVAQEMLDGVGADDQFASAVVQAVRRHATGRFIDLDDAEPESEPQSWPERLLSDACVIATAEHAQDPAALRDAGDTLHSATAHRIVAALQESRERTVTPA